MTSTSTAPHARRTQEERSAATRQALLDATITTLAEHGYVRTTARLVAERAGVSRGACTHHFPTTQELLLAAIGAMFERLAGEFVETFESLPAEERTVATALGELWQVVQGPSYAAVLEIVVASRTDDELGDVVRGVAVMLESTLGDVVRRVFPDLAADPALGTVIDVLLAVVQGAAVSKIAGLGEPDRVIRWAQSAATALIDGQGTTDETRSGRIDLSA